MSGDPAGPVDACPADDGPVFLTRHHDVRQALNDPRFRIHKPLMVGDAIRHMPAAEAANTRAHRISPLLPVLRTHLSARAVQPLAPMVAAFVRARMESARARGRMDVVADLALPLPLAVMAELLGLPGDELHKLQPSFAALSRGHDLGATAQDAQRGRLALLVAGRWLAPRMQQRRPTPLMDAIVAIAQAGNVGDGMLHYWCTMLLYAGSATTSGAMANAIAQMLRDPALARFIAAQPAHVDAAVEELLRVQGPVRGVGRVASEDATVGGQDIRRGQLVYLMLEQANRDPERFTRAGDVDIQRTPNPHLAFGHGASHCMGSHLARMELRETLRAILPYLPGMSPDGDAVPSDYGLLNEHATLPVLVR